VIWCTGDLWNFSSALSDLNIFY